jgi:hypothetical protein
MNPAFEPLMVVVGRLEVIGLVEYRAVIARHEAPRGHAKRSLQMQEGRMAIGAKNCFARLTNFLESNFTGEI